MADLHPDKGLFLSILDELSRPGQIVKNLLAGRGGAAGHHLLQGGANALDAFLPGDWLPNDIARPEDDLSGRDLIGADDSLVGKALGFGVDVLTDPLTYLAPGASTAVKGSTALKVGIPFLKHAAEIPGSAAAMDAIKSSVRTGAEKVVGKDALDAAGRHIKDTFGAPTYGAQTASDIAAHAATRSGVTQAQQTAFANALKILPDEDSRKLAFDIMNNSKVDEATGKLVPILDGSSPTAATTADRAAAMLVQNPEAGRQVDSLLAGDAWQQVKKEGKGRGAIDPLDRGVGIKGVADPLAYDLISDDAKDAFTGLDVFNKHADIQDAAASTLNQAYPLLPTDAEYSSGVAMSNNSLLHPGGGGATIERALEGKDLGGIKAPNEERIAARASAKSAEKLTDVSDAMLTGKPIREKAAVDESISPGTFDTVEGQLERLGQRIDSMGLDPKKADELKAFFKENVPLIQSQYGEAVNKGAMYRIPGIDTAKQMPADYVPRKFTGLKDEAGDVLPGGGLSSTKGRTLRTNESYLDFRNNPENAGVTLQDDIGHAQLDRAAQHGQSIANAELGSKILDRTKQGALAKQAEAMKSGQAAALTEAEEAALKHSGQAMNADGVTAAVKKSLDQMRASGMGADADVLHNVMFGLPERGAFTSLLHKSNGLFKPYATAGYVIPKIGFNTKNRVSGIFQTIADKDARSETMGMVKRFATDMGGAISDAIGLKMPGDELGRVLESIDGAYSSAGGSFDRAVETVSQANPLAGALMRRGVTGGTFARSEDLLSDAKSSGLLGRLHAKAKWPAKITQGIEARMRLGLSMDLAKKYMKEGMPLEAAADKASGVTGRTLYDYSITNPKNRAYRDAVPFGHYMAKAVPQSAKFLAENPAAASVVAAAMHGDNDNPVMPNMQGKINIPVGDNNYITSLGIPLESLGSIPNPSAGIPDFGRQVEQDVVGSIHPLLKTAYSAVSGRDPYFGSAWGSYDKLPLIGEAGTAGRLYNDLAGTGMIAAADQPLKLLNKLSDSRLSAPARAVDVLTGLNFQHVDPGLATQANLTEMLDRNPNVRHFESLSNASKDADTQELIDQLNAVKKQQKAKRQAARMAEMAKGSVL